MKLNIILWMVLVLLGAFVLFGAESLAMQQSLSAKTLRLHVIANSDSAEDQAEKLALRDYLLSLLSPLTEQCYNLNDTVATISLHLEALEASCEEFLAKEGSGQSVKLTLGKEQYDTRNYETFSLPAGEYLSLRALIGKGEGKNWWCVAYPGLCTAACIQDFQTEADTAGYTAREKDLITGKAPQYELRFKLLEWVNSLFRFF